MGEPDYLIEKFWMGFKVAMINFYKRTGCIPRPINYWSSILNNYKINKNYDKIQETIYQYITLYMLDMMRYGCLYSSQLLNTFLKRWATLCDEVSFFNFDKEIDNNYQVFRIYLKIVEMDDIESVKLFAQPELYIFYKNFTPLIKYAIENNKASIIDRVNSITDISEILFKLYSYSGNTNMRGIKLIQRVKKCITIKL